MTFSTRKEIAELLTVLSGNQDWDQKTWERCHELVAANLDDELLDSFYLDFLRYPSLFNLRFIAPLRPTKVSVFPIQPNSTTLKELCSQFLRVATALRRCG